jgi:hypothetical protein
MPVSQQTRLIHELSVIKVVQGKRSPTFEERKRKRTLESSILQRGTSHHHLARKLRNGCLKPYKVQRHSQQAYCHDMTCTV